MDRQSRPYLPGTQLGTTHSSRLLTHKTSDSSSSSFLQPWVNPCIEGVDAFTLSWTGENNWIFPLPYLILRVLKHMEYGKKKGTIVILLWTSALWWPVISTDCRHKNLCWTRWKLFSGMPSYRVHAFRVSFTSPLVGSDGPFF